MGYDKTDVADQEVHNLTPFVIKDEDHAGEGKKKITYLSSVVPAEVLHKIQGAILDDLAAILVNSFGPHGSNTCIKKLNAFNTYTKDGHTILSQVYYNGIIEQAIKDDIESITRNIVNTVGDGTTSAVLMSKSIFHSIHKAMEQNPDLNAADIMRAMDYVGKEMDENDDVRIAQQNTDSSDYRAVQQLEIELSNLAKQLDKIAFDRSDYEAKLADIKAKEEYLAEYTAKFEAAVIADTKAAREKAAGLMAEVEKAQRQREHILEQLPEDMRVRYEKAAETHNGLAVERLEGNVPSVCRMALQASSMSDLARTSSEVVECPYCHRMLVMGEDGEES